MSYTESNEDGSGVQHTSQTFEELRQQILDICQSKLSHANDCLVDWNVNELIEEIAAAAQLAYEVNWILGEFVNIDCPGDFTCTPNLDLSVPTDGTDVERLHALITIIKQNF